MSRFGGDYDEWFPNASFFWEQNAKRAMSGARGQEALKELESALLELPEKRLINSRVATREGDVCAVGALARKRRIEAGEDPAEVQEALARLVPAICQECWHADYEHDEEGCSLCRSRPQAEGRIICSGWKEEAHWTEGDGLETAEEGKRVGLTWVLAWEIAYANDERFSEYDYTPEQRYDAMLQWTRDRIIA